MASYKSIKYYEENERKWIAQHLLKLRKNLHNEIKKERSPGSLIIGSWNIRAFDGGALRENESYHYIAEIIDHFDICAIQEVRPDLKPLERLVGLLGKNWSYFVSDTSGNSERMAFVYNKNKVIFRHIIGEIVLPQGRLINDEEDDKTNIVKNGQIARTPFFASFQADWFKFILCSSHITFGKNTLRTKEIDAISKILSTRSRKTGEVYVFLGDMNIDEPENETMKALEKNKMYVPLFGSTNLAGGKHFDQITFTSEKIKTKYLQHGVFDWSSAVFKADEIDKYRAIAEEKRAGDNKGKAYKKWDKTTYRSWITTEISDHFPIWIELKTDYSDKYLEEKFL